MHSKVIPVLGMAPHPFVMENVQPIGMKLSVQPVKWKVKDAEGHVGLVQKPVVVKDDF